MIPAENSLLEIIINQEYCPLVALPQLGFITMEEKISDWHLVPLQLSF
jgi:hypothetical protein